MLKKALWFLVDFVIPPRCILCTTTIVSPGYICGACWGKLTFISQPYCFQCGFPHEVEIDQDALCVACLKKPPLFQKARSVLIYDEVSKPLILKFKHGDGTYLAPAFVEWMQRVGQDLLSTADYLIPVPLHWQRLIRRRYNQAALLANGLGQRSQVPTLLNAIIRTTNTPSQGHLSPKEREQNVRHAFTIKPKHSKCLKDKKIVLIDDVITSGATVQACTKTLLEQGVSTVDVLTLARVVKPFNYAASTKEVSLNVAMCLMC